MRLLILSSGPSISALLIRKASAYLFTPVGYYFWIYPLNLLVKLKYRDFNFAIFQLLQEAICTTKSFTNKTRIFIMFFLSNLNLVIPVKFK